MRALLTSPLGFLVGVSLGALGGGGSILAVPALVYGAGQEPTHATTTSLVLVVLSAAIGIVPAARARHVRFGAGTVFGAAGIGGSLLGSHWNRAVHPQVLLLAFAVVMLGAAYAMWRRSEAPERPPVRSAGAAAAPPLRARVRLDRPTVVKVLFAGTVVGVMTGFFGVGGGFVIVPALVLALGFDMPDAVGTSLLVITINSMVALSSRLHGGAIEWSTVVPFTIASLAGVVAGGRLARTRPPASLQRGFVGLLVAVALYTGVRSGLALA